MDIVYIRELEIETVIGLYEWERGIRQRLCLDLEMAADIRIAAAGDEIAHTLDYHAVAERLRVFVQESDCLLVETLAERCAQLLMAEFGVRWLRLRISKPGAVAGARDVGVVIERGDVG